MQSRNIILGVGVLVVVVVAAINRAGAQQLPPRDSLDRDYSAELPRIKPRTPEEALSTFQVAPGFRIELVASEPLVADPVAISFDENGRMYVVEMRGYSENGADRISRIRLLDDTNGDGRYDKSNIFVGALSWPTAVFCYDGGVFVADPPDILFFRDNNGDNHADERQVVMTGFARSNVQGLVNSFQWGLDNRIHAATSSSGADISAPSMQALGRPMVLRGRDFSFDPRTLQVQIVSGGAQHGMSFNSWGDKFVCSNSDHIQHVVFEDYLVARNPYFPAPSPRRSIAVDGPQAEVFRTSPVEPWRIVRTRLRAQGLVPGPLEGGGRPAGYFSGATGVTIYRGNAWPREYVDWAIIGDVGSNLVHRKRLDADGVTYSAHRVDEQSEFLTSTDIWFRPCQFANAPDGTLYVLDMYREVIEHPASLHPIIKQHLDLTSGRDLGRIYRIVPDGFQQPPLPRLGDATTAELVATLAHDNGWHRDTASRLLYQRQDRSAIPLLRAQALKSRTPVSRIASLHALAGMRGLTPDLLQTVLSDTHPRVREHAVGLSHPWMLDSSALRDQLIELAADPDVRVRYQLAFTLGWVSGTRRDLALASIARRDAGDRYLRVAIMSSLAEGAGRVLAELAGDEVFRKSDAGREWLTSLAAQIGKQQRPEDVAGLLEVLRSLTNDSEGVQLLVRGAGAKSGSTLDRHIAAATQGIAGRVMRELVDRAESTARSAERNISERTEAIHLLRLGPFNDRRELFAALLKPAEPVEVQSAALATLASLPDAGVADLLLAAWPTLSPRMRLAAADVLGSRGPWLLSLLQAVAAGTIPAGDVDPVRLRLYAEHAPNPARAIAQGILRRNPVGNRSDVLAAYRGVWEMPGDAARGKALFGKVCASCHQLGGVGHAIGPNLATMQNRGPEAIVSNVLAPNQELNPQYVNYVIVTKDGRQVTGIITAETANSITLQRAENQVDVILRIDIEELRSTGLSLMPEGLEKEIDKSAMADLLEFLRTVQ